MSLQHIHYFSVMIWFWLRMCIAQYVGEVYVCVTNPATGHFPGQQDGLVL